MLGSMRQLTPSLHLLICNRRTITFAPLQSCCCYYIKITLMADCFSEASLLASRDAGEISQVQDGKQYFGV